MKPTLVIYATRHGQTRKIAEHLGDTLSAQHHITRLIDAASLPPEFSVNDYSSAIVCASIHQGKHESEMAKFVKRHRAQLEQIPTAFVSVSLSEAGAEDEHAPAELRAQAVADVKRTIESFLTETAWHPTYIKAAAGALKYRSYGFVTRFFMRRIAKKVGAPTDTSQNHEFTNWAKVDRIVEELLQNDSLEAPANS